MLTPGTRVGPYEIVDKLGEGGMGLVYRAADTKLGRDVALKILPAAVTADPERLARFDREARTLASLNHPHIAQIYGIEVLPDAGGHQSALVMELVEGEDLAQRIARGPLPVDEALHIARQIADALAAAHEQRVVHRDLKPANIRIRHDGAVKGARLRTGESRGGGIRFGCDGHELPYGRESRDDDRRREQSSAPPHT